MSLYEEIQACARRYPEGSRSATIPALRLAQEHYGWLSPEALREVADALELTPAYCHAVASFYDMFHLEPVGEHLVEVCTNLSCALVGAQRWSRRSRRSSASASARRREDGKSHASARSSASAAAARRRSSRSTTATASGQARRRAGDRGGDPMARVAFSSPARRSRPDEARRVRGVRRLRRSCRRRGG